jgi:hypothetical protein
MVVSTRSRGIPRTFSASDEDLQEIKARSQVSGRVVDTLHRLQNFLGGDLSFDLLRDRLFVQGFL